MASPKRRIAAERGGAAAERRLGATGRNGSNGTNGKKGFKRSMGRGARAGRVGAPQKACAESMAWLKIAGCESESAALDLQPMGPASPKMPTLRRGRACHAAEFARCCLCDGVLWSDLYGDR